VADAALDKRGKVRCLISRYRLPYIGVQGNPVKTQNVPQEDFRFKAGLFDAVGG